MPVETLTFGCRLNAAESALMQARAEEAGLADAILVNTCAVTGEAVRQARQAIRRAKRENPARRIVVAGCAAQIEPETFARMPEVDRVLGNGEKLRADSYRLWSPPNPPHAEALREAEPRSTQIGAPSQNPIVLRGNADGAGIAPQDKELRRWEARHHPSPLPDFGVAASEKIRVGDIFSIRETASHLAEGFAAGDAHRVRAFVEVQNGCDHRCTFCIIPYGRGNSRSVPAGAVVNSIQRLVASGAREVVLTGVDITAWGADLPGQPKLGALVRAILKHVPELPRLRLSSIDSVEADAELLRAVADEERLMPHLHLSLQSGDDMILKRMKRRHSRADAIRFCERVRRLRPDVVFGADMIVGFPTETDAMFENSFSLVSECGLTFLHVFPFSPRTGTPAARMPLLPKNLVQVRAMSMRHARDSALSAFLSSEVGKLRKILVEQPGVGRTEHYAPVAVDAGVPGKIISARIAGFDAKRLIAQEIRAAA